MTTMTHQIERLRFITDHDGARDARGPRVAGHYEGTGVYTTPEDARSLDELGHAAEHATDDATRRAAAEEALRRLAARDLGLDDALRVERAGELASVPADLAARAAVVGRASNGAGRSWHAVHACTEQHMVAWGRAGELAAEVAVGRAAEIPGSPGWYLRAPWTDGAARALLGLADPQAAEIIAAVEAMKHDEGITLETVDHMGRVHPAPAPPAPPAHPVPVAPEYHAMLDAIAPVLPHYAELIIILRGVFSGVAPMGDFDRESDRVTDDMERVEKYHNSTLDDTSAAWALGVLSNLCDIARSTQNARNCLRSMAGHPAG